MAPTPGQPPLRVLLTGFGPFSRTSENPSWLAVRDLNGTLLQPPSSTKRSSPPIHITSFEIPVVYSSVLSIVPPLHARPPQLPPPESLLTPIVDPGLPPPADGYDLIIHVGLGRKGGLSLEMRGRKANYFIPDVDGKLPPIIPSEIDEDSARKDSRQQLLSENVRFEAERANHGTRGSEAENPPKAIRRGFAEGYEQFPDELWTQLDVDNILTHLRSRANIKKAKASDDAGLYLCEFINYCAMAESRRHNVEKNSKVLFVHVPPIGEDLTLEQITNGLTSIIEHVCWESVNSSNS